MVHLHIWLEHVSRLTWGKLSHQCAKVKMGVEVVSRSLEVLLPVTERV